MSVYAEVEAIGNTSITMLVKAFRRRRHADERKMVTEARFKFVALDEDGRPRPVPRPEAGGAPPEPLG